MFVVAPSKSMDQSFIDLFVAERLRELMTYFEELAWVYGNDPYFPAILDALWKRLPMVERNRWIASGYTDMEAKAAMPSLERIKQVVDAVKAHQNNEISQLRKRHQRHQLEFGQPSKVAALVDEDTTVAAAVTPAAKTPGRQGPATPCTFGAKCWRQHLQKGCNPWPRGTRCRCPRVPTSTDRLSNRHRQHPQQTRRHRISGPLEERRRVVDSPIVLHGSPALAVYTGERDPATHHLYLQHTHLMRSIRTKGGPDRFVLEAAANTELWASGTTLVTVTLATARLHPKFHAFISKQRKLRSAVRAHRSANILAITDCRDGQLYRAEWTDGRHTWFFVPAFAHRADIRAAILSWHRRSSVRAALDHIAQQADRLTGPAVTPPAAPLVGVEPNPGPLATARATRAEAEISDEDEPPDAQYVPPAPRLVCVETNPGPSPVTALRMPRLIPATPKPPPSNHARTLLHTIALAALAAAQPTNTQRTSSAAWFNAKPVGITPALYFAAEKSKTWHILPEEYARANSAAQQDYFTAMREGRERPMLPFTPENLELVLNDGHGMTWEEGSSPLCSLLSSNSQQPVSSSPSTVTMESHIHSREEIAERVKYHPSVDREAVIDLLYQFRDALDFKPAAPDELRLPPFDLQLREDGVLPAEVHRPVPFRVDAAGPCEDTIDAWVAAGAAMWVPPNTPAFGFLFSVKKANGKWRVTTNTVAVNNATVPQYDGGVMPNNMLDNLHAMHGHKWFFSIDMREGFTSVKLTPDASKLLTFATPWGKLRYLVGCYGPRDMPLHFQKALDEHVVQPCTSGAIEPDREYHGQWDDLRNVATTRLWLNDCIGGVRDSATRPDTCLELQRRLLTWVREFHCRINLGKSSFNLTEVAHVGLITDGKTIRIDPERITGIKDLPLPNTLKQLQAGIGTYGYYFDFVPAELFTKLLGPLTALKHASFDASKEWHPYHTKCWKLLGDIIASAAPLLAPDFTKPVYVKVDATNDYGYGVILLQYDDDHRPRPVAHVSVGWKTNELSWTPNTKEAAALYRAVCDIAPLFAPGANLVLETDHRNWAGDGIAKSPDPLVRECWGRICCQPAVLLKYHIPGALNAADFPSRVAHPASAPRSLSLRSRLIAIHCLHPRHWLTSLRPRHTVPRLSSHQYHVPTYAHYS